MVLLNLIVVDVAQAQSINVGKIIGVQAVETSKLGEIIEQLKTQLETILTPEQREKFQSAIVEGTSARKAFKTPSLSPDQKSKLATSFKSLPKKDIFTSMTPEEKKQFFLSKKAFFLALLCRIHHQHLLFTSGEYLVGKKQVNKSSPKLL